MLHFREGPSTKKEGALVASITTHYGIAGSVPFHNINVSCDNRLYLDPHAIWLTAGPQPFAHDAVTALDSFFTRISLDAMSASPAERRRGLNLLQHFEEPWETRLGMAETGFRGHGGADDIGQRFWDAMTTDLVALLRVGVLKHLEELPLFVKGVDRDITSDVTTRIVFAALANFTAQMIERYPEFTSGGNTTVTVERQVWDVVNEQWERKTVVLPVADGKPLLLIPAGWARATLLMSARRFYDTKVLSFAQDEQAVVTTDGTVLKTPKDRLREQESLKRGRHTNQVITLRADAAGVDLLSVFRRYVDSKATRNAA